MKRRIKLVRNDKTEAFSDGLEELLDEIHEMTYREIQTCLAYFSFVMASHIMRSEEIKQYGAHTVLRETLADMKAPCIFGIRKRVRWSSRRKSKPTRYARSLVAIQNIKSGILIWTLKS